MNKNSININNRCVFLLSFLFLFLTNCSSNSATEIPEIPIVETENKWIIYEVNPKLFEKDNSFNSIANRLDEIQEMGVNVVWLMPIYEEGIEKAFGSPYSVKDYKKVNTSYGSLEDLKALVNKAHTKKMKVILDWVANHSSWDNSWIENKDWYTQNANGDIISPPEFNWSDVADLNYNNLDMRHAMIDAMKYWITEVGVDGYRCDYAEGVPSDFWKESIKELRKLKGDDLIMLAEGGKASLFSDGFDIIYGWDFAFKLQDLYNGKISLRSFYETQQKEYQNVPEGKHRMRYSTNHDMASDESPIQVYKGEKGAMSAFVIATTMGGSPMIYSSQEVGYSSPLSFFNFRAIDWSSNPTYSSEYKKVMNIYNNSKALRKGVLRTFDTENVVSFYRESNNEGVLIMVNITDKKTEVKVPIEFANEKMKNLLDNSSETLPTVLELEPFQYKILQH